MKLHNKAILLLGRLVVLLLPSALEFGPLLAQTGSTQTAIHDTVRLADGTAARGTVLISWPAFTSAAGTAVQTGSTSVTLAADGSLDVSLVPNVGGTPIGSFYTVVYHLTGGTVTREYWQVPVSGTPVALPAVRSSVLPTSVAVQTVSKQYVDRAIARAALSAAPQADGSPYVEKAGDTMTGALTLPGDPVSPLQAADKNYVDAGTAALQAGLDQKVSKLPTATQVVTQPAGTQLRANRLNGTLHAGGFLSQAGNDGIRNAFASPECAGACTVVVDPDYPGTDAAVPSQTGAHLVDLRNGRVIDSHFDPVGDGGFVAHTLNARFTESATGGDLFGIGQRITHIGYSGGNNLFPENYGFTVPYFKSTYSATDTVYRQFTQGQHVMDSHTIDCHGVGDCILRSYYMRASGGFRDAADEGSHPYDLQLTEDPRVFQGVCAGGCTTGSQTLQVTATDGAGTQGSGRFLIDKAPAKTIRTGQLVGGNPGAFPAATAQFTGTSFVPGTFFFTAAAIPPQSNTIAPGTVSIAIQTSGVPAGFSTNTAASPSGSGMACIADAIAGGSATPENYEMGPFTVVDGTHLRLTLNKPHGPGAIVSIGGLCGYGLEQVVDTTGGIRQVFPVIGTIDATNLYVASGLSSIVGRNQTTSNFLNVSYDVTSVTRSNGVVTVTVTNPAALDSTGVAMTLSGVADAGFNGRFAMSLVAGNQFQFAQSGPDASSTGGRLQLLTGSYVLYPMAETLDVYDPATGGVTGKMTLAPNNVAWAANDPVEQPHYFQEKVSADVEYITQYTPRPNVEQQAGVYYQGNNGPGLHGFVVANTADGYLGSGGTRQAPDVALQTQGIWNTALDMQAGEQTAIRLRCNSRGCGRFNSTYNLFQLDFVPGGAQYDKVTYAPQSGTMQWTLHGTQYTMSPTAMTVGTLNVTNLNAAHITGVSGAGPATSAAQGTVQLGPQATSATLANVATSGLASDLAGTLAAAQSAALSGDVSKAAGSALAVVTGASEGRFKSGSTGLADYPGTTQASQDPSLWTSYAFTDSNVKVAGHAFAHGVADNNTFNRAAGNCDTLSGFGGGLFAGCAYASYDARTSYQGSSNYNHYVGFQAAGELHPGYTGTTDQWYGFVSVPKINGGTVNNVFGFRAENPAGGGTVKNAFGAYIDEQTAGTQGNYGLVVKQSSSGNQLDGLLQSNQNIGGFGGAYFRNTSTDPYNYSAVQLENLTPAQRVIFSSFGPNWPTGISILLPSSGYLASGTAHTNGLILNTEAAGAPIRLATNGGYRAVVADNRFQLMSGVVYNAPLSTPASSSDACTAGDFKDDANFHYVCVSANTWKRAALSAF